MNSILEKLFSCSKQISRQLQTKNPLQLGSAISGSQNLTGDIVKEMDIRSNNLIRRTLYQDPLVKFIGSEEEDDFLEISENKHGEYLVTYDPLDGSSNIDINMPTGTIFGIWKCENPYNLENSQDLTNNWTSPGRIAQLAGASSLSGSFENEIPKHVSPRKSLVAAGYCLYSAATQMVVATESGVNMYQLKNGRFIKLLENVFMPDKGKIYSYNEAYNYIDNRLENTVNVLKSEGYTSRYVGSMVGDVHRTLLKGGIFMYPETDKNLNGKLRLLYEAYPMAYIIEKAGGMTTNGEESILDIPFPEDVHARTPVILSSKYEMNKFMS